MSAAVERELVDGPGTLPAGVDGPGTLPAGVDGADMKAVGQQKNRLS